MPGAGLLPPANRLCLPYTYMQACPTDPSMYIRIVTLMALVNTVPLELQLALSEFCPLPLTFSGEGVIT